jgi:serine/threonine protein kinase
VWSFGITVIELFTRQRPYPGEDGLSIAAQISSGTILPQSPANCPPELQQLLLSCWQYEPASRPDMETIVRVIETIPDSSFPTV